ncbi:cobalamin-binding protein [Nocardioides sp. CFH 31398]|uniref:cobalamin-binding protein n=1 Tax=Nocardioides sp. CFH 31398 TaxID=2919579 RepID=UPI001F054070|nr:cobalamin-binding protein [Nocardioides sp. CFH 31398]MCH1865825.1 cobalamin-binding protein [Nocardioides sp. CFH 31398]
MRICSLLPSTTEICFALGAGDDVVGVTFECDHPPEARSRRVVSTSAMPEGLDPAGIDAWVADAARRGVDLYRLDAGALADLDAELVLTQDLCAVCAIDVDTVAGALGHLGSTADVLTVDPHTLDEVWDSVLRIGEAVGRPEAAASLVADLRGRLDAVAARVAGRPRPRVAVLEWPDPPYAPGHWVPEMVTAAGGENVLGEPGARSVRTTWEALAATQPDVVVVAACGYDLPATTAMAERIRAEGLLPDHVRLHPVDADAHWVRPGPRLVDGVEELAAALHP